MAASGSNTQDATYDLIHKLEDMVECAICLEKLKEPRLLCCQHSYCTSCLQQMLGPTRKSIQCPSCNQVTKVNQGVQELLVDFRANSWLEIMSEFRKAKAARQVEEETHRSTTNHSIEKCPVCEGICRSAVVLSCWHGVCETCVNFLLPVYGSSINCPTCGKETDIIDIPSITEGVHGPDLIQQEFQPENEPLYEALFHLLSGKPLPQQSRSQHRPQPTAPDFGASSGPPPSSAPPNSALPGGPPPNSALPGGPPPNSALPSGSPPSNTNPVGAPPFNGTTGGPVAPPVVKSSGFKVRPTVRPPAPPPAVKGTEEHSPGAQNQLSYRNLLSQLEALTIAAADNNRHSVMPLRDVHTTVDRSHRTGNAGPIAPTEPAPTSSSLNPHASLVLDSARAGSLQQALSPVQFSSAESSSSLLTASESHRPNAALGQASARPGRQPLIPGQNPMHPPLVPPKNTNLPPPLPPPRSVTNRVAIPPVGNESTTVQGQGRPRSKCDDKERWMIDNCRGERSTNNGWASGNIDNNNNQELVPPVPTTPRPSLLFNTPNQTGGDHRSGPSSINSNYSDGQPCPVLPPKAVDQLRGEIQHSRYNPDHKPDKDEPSCDKSKSSSWKGKYSKLRFFKGKLKPKK